MYDAATDRCRQILFAATAAGLLATLALPRLTGFSVDLASFAPIFLLIGVFALFIPYTAWRGMRRLRSALEASTLGLLLTLPVLIFSYAAMRAALPLADDLLIAADRAIGFDWPAFVRWVDGVPALARALALGYSSFALQLLFLPILLALLGFERRAYRLVIGYGLLCTAAIVVSTGFPALGAYEGHGVDGRSLAHVDAHFGYFFLESFHGIREDRDYTLALGSAAGIVTFPSIHAGVALLCTWAAWSSRWLRVPFAALNLLMAVSAVSHGAHYLVDVLAGCALAAVAAAAAVRLTRLAPAPEPAPAMQAAPAFP